MSILSYQFFQNALLVSVFASLAAGIIGTYIVVKRMSLISGSISHAAFGGLGLSYYLGQNPLIGAVLFSLGSAFGIAALRKKARDRLDILLSFLWATGMAIGLVFIFLTPGYATDLFTYLFGNLLLVGGADIWMIVVLDALIILSVLFFYHPIQAVIFDAEYAETRNLPVFWIYALFLGIIALSIVTLIRVVGVVLLIALLTMPAATAQLFNRTLKGMMVTASAITLFAMVSGLFVSYALNFATGPIIVLIISGLYVAGLGLSKLA